MRPGFSALLAMARSYKDGRDALSTLAQGVLDLEKEIDRLEAEIAELKDELAVERSDS